MCAWKSCLKTLNRRKPACQHWQHTRMHACTHTRMHTHTQTQRIQSDLRWTLGWRDLVAAVGCRVRLALGCEARLECVCVCVCVCVTEVLLESYCDDTKVFHAMRERHRQRPQQTYMPPLTRRVIWYVGFWSGGKVVWNPLQTKKNNVLRVLCSIFILWVGVEYTLAFVLAVQTSNRQ